MGLIDQMMANIYKPPRQEKQTTVPSKGVPLEKTSGTTGQTALTQGQLLKGEVLDLRASQILVLLENGTTVSARTEGTLNLSIGQQANFLVAQTSEEQILLKLAAEDTPAQNPMIDKVLQTAHIQKTERSISIVTELLSHQQPVNEANIRHYLSLSARYPEVPVKSLVLMELHHIPVTKENVTQLVQYQNKQAQLLNQAQELVKELFTAAGQLPEGEFRQGIFKELNSLFETDTFRPVPEQTVVTAPESPEGDTKTPLPAAETTDTAKLPDSIEQFTASDTETAAVFPDVSEPPTTPEEQTATALPDAPEYSTTPEKQPAAIFSDTSKHLIAENSERFFKEENPLFSSFLLPPEDVAEPEKIQKYYKELSEKVTKLEQLAGRLAENNTKTVSDMPKQIKQNLSFMDAVNNVFPYIQLPLKFKEAPAHGELYVYEKKKNLKPSDSLSALLHLELEALGTTDIYVTLSGSHVTTRFSMSDKESMQLVRSELPSLSEALAKKGYHLQSEVTMRETETADSPCLLEQFLEEQSPAQLTRYSFDIRA